MSGKNPPLGRTILVVDDDEATCGYLKSLLELEGFDVLTCHNGREAVLAAGREKIDLILLDWMMPVLSGFEVLKTLQADERRGIPVVVITAKVTDQETVDMIRQEMNVVDFVPKPIRSVLFLKNLHSILGTGGRELRR
ncbi:MAG: hypothetical protein A2902_01550 [Elusimicrobia bacterium RIFCSPLOWO2_01_FULL_64_13]|nr:MAG: hypothetical protein A2636_06745 [Elusimicrobia bacterium RIFCSPHIGHO2_01_FULL_64_10]OGR95517.1 MAG: hypothetical protein A2902_01550 [Elusimicrobia bacterium RIFCSPLOWO2_01_FULL_64_13]